MEVGWNTACILQPDKITCVQTGHLVLSRLVSALLCRLLLADAHNARRNNKKDGKDENAPPHSQERNEELVEDTVEGGAVGHGANFAETVLLGRAVVVGSLVHGGLWLGDVDGVGAVETRRLSSVVATEAWRAVVGVGAGAEVTAGGRGVLGQAPGCSKGGFSLQQNNRESSSGQKVGVTNVLKR